MATRRRYLDPATGDHVIVSGGFREDMTPVSQVVARLRAQRGSIVGLPWFGSRLHDVRKRSPDVESRVRAMVVEALADLSRSGRLPDLRVSPESTSQGILITISFRDPEGRRRSIPYLHRMV